MARWILPLIAALLLAACSFSADTKVAESGVTRFHASLNSGRFEEIYNNAGPEFKSATTGPDFTKLLDAIHRKLGKFQSGKTIGWNANIHNGEHFVTLNREAQFERGPAQEQFIFKVEGSTPVLLGYHINSNALITG